MEVITSMKPIVELSECLRDTPTFRAVLQDNEEEVDYLETKLDKLVKLCNSMVESGKSFVSSNANFIYALKELGVLFKEDNIVSNSLNQFVHILNEMMKYHSILVDQAQRSICNNLTNFIKNDVKKVKETKKYFEKISEDLDNALSRHSQIPRAKVNEFEEAGNILTAVRSCFQHTGLDYVAQISCLKSKRRFEILETFLSLMHAYSTYFHQGSELIEDSDSFFKHLAGTITTIKEETVSLDKELEGRHSQVILKDIVPVIVKNVPTNGCVRLEGYLFKRTSNAFKTWNRRWFIMEKNQLVYRKRSPEDTLTVMEEDLRLCTVKPAVEVDRRFCFEVLSPSKSHTLQADSEEACRQWIVAMQEGIDAALNNTNDQPLEKKNNVGKSLDDLINPAPPKPPRSHNFILSIPGNNLCCDCRLPDPRWASINLGITLCIECSGIHRSMGVHISKVRSLTLDTWEAEILKVMAELGNDVINKIYEAEVDESVCPRAHSESTRAEREAWIKAKYVKRAFLRKPGSPTKKELNIDKLSVPSENDDKSISSSSADLNDEILTTLESKSADGSETADESYASASQDVEDSSSENESNTKTIIEKIKTEECDSVLGSNAETIVVDPNLMLFNFTQSHDIPEMAQALALGASPCWKNDTLGGREALHEAVNNGSNVLCDFLILNGAKVNNQDSFGKTPLHLATELGFTGVVCLLLKRGANQHATDNAGKDALTVAVENANADIVTLLRLARLNEEMRRDEFGNPGDETFNEVVKDFSKMASDTPEKLLRRQSITESESSTNSLK